MKSAWYVMYNPMGGYIAARTRDVTQIVHSGNLEYSGNYSENKQEIAELVKKLNEAEGIASEKGEEKHGCS